MSSLRSRRARVTLHALLLLGLLLGPLLGLSLGSCATLVQDSVRSSGVYCSTSRFYYLTDLVLATGLAVGVSSIDGPPESYLPTAVLAGSGVYGIFKRGRCLRHRETATPEEWARDAARESDKDAARFAAMRSMAANLRTPPPPESAPPAATAPPASSPSPATSGSSGTAVRPEQAPAPPESTEPALFACRNQCKREYDTLVEDCRVRADVCRTACSAGNDDCATGCASWYATCASSNKLVTCSKAC